MYIQNVSVNELSLSLDHVVELFNFVPSINGTRKVSSAVGNKYKRATIEAISIATGSLFRA